MYGFTRAKRPSSQSDGSRPVIPSECEGSKKDDFSLCSKQGFLPELVLSFVEGVEMTTRAFASWREIFRIVVAAQPRWVLHGAL